MKPTPLFAALEDLMAELCELDRRWVCERERSGLHHAQGDIIHHVCSAATHVEALPPELAHYDQLSGEARVLAHEAYLSVLALGQLLLRAVEDQLADGIAIARTQVEVDEMLDMLTPLVSRADDGLRRVLLEGMSIETAVEGIRQ